MEDIGDVLYWILIVGAIVVSSISSLKEKQKEQPKPQPQPQSWNDEMRTPPPPPAPKKKKKTPPPVARPQQQRAQSSFVASEEGVSMFGENTAFLMDETEVVIMDDLDLTDVNAFRKAVIYAEILNRKY
jgi:hypothetical protein